MRRVAAVLALLALTGCGQAPDPEPAGPAPLTPRIVASEAVGHLGEAPASGTHTTGSSQTWRAVLDVLPETRVTVDVVEEQGARRQFGSCRERVRHRGVESCEQRPGYGVPVILEARSGTRWFSWTAVALAGRGLLREATMTVQGPVKPHWDDWIEGENLPGVTLDQLIAVALDPDLSPVSTAAAAQRAASLTGFRAAR